MKLVSLRSVLLGEITDFLNLVGMSCVHTQTGLADLINSLSQYKEEGKSLFPQIYIFDDFETVKKTLPQSLFIKIGEGLKDPKIIGKALKKCAPLTSIYWCIYILRIQNRFEFGVFTSGTNLLSVSPENALITNGSMDIKVILVHQVSDKMVELRFPSVQPVVINFGIQLSTTDSPKPNQEKFINFIIFYADAKYKEQLKSFYEKVFLKVTQEGHGTLAIALDRKTRTIPKKLSDGIILSQEINVVEAISMLKSADKELVMQANRKLDAYLNLISGMLMNDGVTVFINNGSVVAYNVFIKHPNKKTGSGVTGGARTRTYEVLKSLIGKTIKSSYFQSQDGKTLTDHGE